MKIYSAKNKFEIQISNETGFRKDIEVDADGVVYVNKKCSGAAIYVFKRYSSFSGAKASAKRLAKKLENAGDKYNAIVDKWFE